MRNIDVREIFQGRFSPTMAAWGVTTFVELVWVLSGQMLVRLGKDDFRMSPGDVICYAPTKAIWIETGGHETRVGCVRFVSDGATPPRFWPAEASGVCEPLLAHLLLLEKGGILEWREAASRLVPYVLDLLDQVGRTPTVVSTAVARACDHIVACWESPGRPLPGLGELARATNLSKEHLCRIFRNELGVTPVAAVRLLRLQHGANLLIGTDRSLGSIAAECGYASESHFSHAFAQVAGTPPSRYRRQLVSGSLLPAGLRQLFARIPSSGP